MNELMEKVDILLNKLDEQECVKEIKKLNNKLVMNKELLDLIKEYRVTGNEEIKNKIISDEIYSKYKHYENEVNFIILNIRSKLKVINDKKGCIK
ncbi:MAG: hypothetical protein IKH54_06800 [Bacilli bacterium]|nr:hypothetical protein [Bacilli bacterium]